MRLLLSPLLPLLLSLSAVCWAGDALVGGKHKQDGDDEKYRALAEKAVAAHNAQSNDLFLWALRDVHEVHTQIVAGVKHTIHLTMQQTKCTKQGGVLKAAANCEKSNKIQKCTASIVTRSWEDFEEAKMQSCEEPTLLARKRRRSVDARPVTDKQQARMSKHMQRWSAHIKDKDYVAWKRFEDWVESHERLYSSKRTTLAAFRTFKRNLKAAAMWQKREKGTAVYGETPFMDMTSHQFKETLLHRWGVPATPNTRADFDKHNVTWLGEDEGPSSFDWREKGAVTEVKNQGSCGSCWAFSTTGNIEGAWFLAKGKLVSLSEQELVDCDIVDQGCNGGLPSNAYKEIIRMGGLEPEDKYPYEGRGETCHLAREDVAVTIDDSVELPHDEEAMRSWLLKKGPISIGINANPLQFYRHGISHPWKIFCEPFMLNHGVLIVGYGVEKKKPYWIVKNSWSTKWGENGYYRLYRGKNVCGVQEMATSAIVNP